MIAEYRLGEWPGLVPLHASGSGGRSLPAAFFSDSWDKPLQLGDGLGKIVALLAFTEEVPKLDPATEWYAIDHQSGGLACHHPRFIGTPLSLRPGIRDRLEELAARYIEADGGHFYRGSLGASDVVAYVAALADLGLHCERSYPLLEEGVYPIDATQDHLDLIAYDAPSLDQVADRSGYGGLTILVLAENSD
jgi:hypothetical protein